MDIQNDIKTECINLAFKNIKSTILLLTKNELAKLISEINYFQKQQIMTDIIKFNFMGYTLNVIEIATEQKQKVYGNGKL